MKNYSNFLKKSEWTIFLLHGVIEHNPYQVRNYNRKHILSKDFELFITQLCDIGTPLSLDEGLSSINSQEPFPDKAFSITFDDGFENNFSVAAPILQKHKVPACFYITTKFINDNFMSWIDRIEYAVEESAEGVVKFAEHLWSFNNTVKSKINTLDNVRKVLKSQKHCDLNAVASDFQAHLNMAEVTKSNSPLDKKMTWEQVKALSDDRLFIIGGHTHTHPVLANLTDEDSKSEIEISLDLIQKKINKKIKHFSYPEGLAYCYTDREINYLKACDVVCSPSAIEGSNTLNSDPFHLRRINVT